VFQDKKMCLCVGGANVSPQPNREAAAAEEQKKAAREAAAKKRTADELDGAIPRKKAAVGVDGNTAVENQ